MFNPNAPPLDGNALIGEEGVGRWVFEGEEEGRTIRREVKDEFETMGSVELDERLIGRTLMGELRCCWIG